ncbi:MAG TPA: ANTAR domain-containing protein [Actinomycetota bacterium]
MGTRMEDDGALRVLIADGEGPRLREVTQTVVALGHDVIAHESGLSDVGPATARLKPDVAVVIVGESSEHSLGMIDRIVREAACPIIAVLAVQDRTFINEAARRGIFAYLTHEGDPAQLQSSMDIVLRRFAEYHNLEGAFGRRALLERAKGILMERHSIDEREAFEMLRQEARRNSRKIVEVAEAVLAAHPMMRQLKGSDSP